MPASGSETNDWIDPLNKPSFQESRPYQDLFIKVPLFEGKMLSRTRFEQRINQANGSLGLRAREWIQYTHTLELISDQLSLYLVDEVILYLNNNSFGRSGFSENRVLTGLSYQFTTNLGLDPGYLGQYVVNRSGRDLFTHNLSANLRYAFE